MEELLMYSTSAACARLGLSHTDMFDARIRKHPELEPDAWLVTYGGKRRPLYLESTVDRLGILEPARSTFASNTEI